MKQVLLVTELDSTCKQSTAPHTTGTSADHVVIQGDQSGSSMTML
jgi:hypothetical protein